MKLLHFGQLTDSLNCLKFKEFPKTDKGFCQSLTFFKRGETH